MSSTLIPCAAAVLRHVAAAGEDKLDPRHPLEAGVLDSRCGRGCIPFMEGSNEVTASPEVSEVIQGEAPRRFFEGLLGGEVLTFDYKWLRGVHRVSRAVNEPSRSFTELEEAPTSYNKESSLNNR